MYIHDRISAAMYIHSDMDKYSEDVLKVMFYCKKAHKV